jgi:hypothetical protein
MEVEHEHGYGTSSHNILLQEEDRQLLLACKNATRIDDNLWNELHKTVLLTKTPKQIAIRYQYLIELIQLTSKTKKQ